MILAHRVSRSYGGKSTVSLFKQAFKSFGEDNTQTISDGGSENDNHEVHKYLQTMKGKLTIAGIDIDFQQFYDRIIFS